MPERHWRSLFLRLGSEAALWYCLPAAFLATYLTRYAAPATAVLPHLRLIALALFALALVRLAAACWLPRIAARLLSAKLAAGLAATLLIYYGLAIVGLDSWGRVISWGLITTYAAQALELAASLGLSTPALLAGIGGAYVALFLPATNYARAGVRSGLDVPGENTVNFYDNGVVQADTAIAGLLETLGRKGFLRDALIVITADHGEHLGENGTFGHGNSVDEPALRVPLLFLSYGYRPSAPFAGTRSAAQVDIAPTILAELGMPIPATWVGQPLQQAEQAPFGFFQQGTQAGLFDRRQSGRAWKYWIDARTSEEHAYDLSNDPAESRNVIDEVAVELRREWRLRVLPAVTQSFPRL